MIVRSQPFPHRVLALAATMLCASACSARATTFDPHDPHSPLRLVRTVALPNVRGRIDHLALDESTNQLFVAEIGNGTVDALDLASGRVSGRIAGLREPQGVAWLPAQEELAVACGDGLVRFFRRGDWREVARVSLGDDADNVRIDPRNGHLVVGYGSGGLAIIDPSTHQILGRVSLGGHPEAFEIDGAKVFVNLPGKRSIAVADLDRGRVLSTLPTGILGGNYPMALNPAGSTIAVAFRFPATVSVIDVATGRMSFSVSSCRDADDIYFAAGRLAVVCGQGAVDLVSLGAGHAVDRVTTAPGARTGLLSADGRSLYVAAPARGTSAQLWQLTFATPIQ